jgi:hypothetical protein
MRALLSRLLDRTLPDSRPDEMFFMAGPPRPPRPLVSTREMQIEPPPRRLAWSRQGHGHPSI